MPKWLMLPTSGHEVLGFESCWGQNSLYCTQPFIFILPSSQYDLNSVGRDVRHQIIFFGVLESLIDGLKNVFGFEFYFRYSCMMFLGQSLLICRLLTSYCIHVATDKRGYPHHSFLIS